MFNLISIPQEVFVAEWLKTPQPQKHREQQEEKIERVATSGLATWTDD